MAPINQISTTRSSSSSSTPRDRDLKDSTQLHSSTKSIFRDNNGRSSTSFKKSFSSDEFVDKRTGRLGVKDETTYCRTDKYDNKNEGYAHEFETKVRLKHVAYPKPCSSPNRQIKDDDDGLDDGDAEDDDDGCDDADGDDDDDDSDDDGLDDAVDDDDDGDGDDDDDDDD